MIDTDYEGESFFVRHCYFTGGRDPYKQLKRALNTNIDEEAWASLYRTESRPFPKLSTGKIAGRSSTTTATKSSSSTKFHDSFDLKPVGCKETLYTISSEGHHFGSEHEGIH